MAITMSDTILASGDVVAREVGGELVLMDLASGTYFGLNEVGGMIWASIEDESKPLEQLVRDVCENYGVAEETAREDLIALVNSLRDHDLIVVNG